MISERDEDQRNGRPSLALSLVVSAVLNLAAWMLVIWATGVRLDIVPKIEEPKYLIASSSIRIEHRTVPEPPHPVTRSATRQRAAQSSKAAPAPQPTEISRIVRNAPPQPQVEHPSKHTPATLQAQLAQQQQTFEREAEALNAQHRTISIATSPPEPPSAEQRSYLNVSGRDTTESVEALLEPLPGHHWVARGMSCYYVHYYAQYSGGGSEEGNIPWPLCYPVDHDAMLPLDRSHRLPIPSPPVGYVLPAGTTLAPLLHAIYTGELKNDRG